VKTPYRFVALLATIALAAGGSTAFAHGGGGGHHGGKGGGHHGDRHGGQILRSGLVGSTPNTPLFGVPSGGAAWTIGNSDVRVSADRVRVRGRSLLLANGTVGPVQMVAAAVFCNGATDPAFTTPAVPLDPDGDFRIDADVTTPLPSPCLVPAVLVRIAQAGGVPNPAGPYIAANGGNAPAPAAAPNNNNDDND
jgi:hypothetical protein